MSTAFFIVVIDEIQHTVESSIGDGRMNIMLSATGHMWGVSPE